MIEAVGAEVKRLQARHAGDGDADGRRVRRVSGACPRCACGRCPTACARTEPRLSGEPAHRVSDASTSGPRCKPGERVLLHAAAGGVGLLALQIMKRRLQRRTRGRARRQRRKSSTRAQPWRRPRASTADACDYVEEVDQDRGGQGVRLRRRRRSKAAASTWRSTACRAPRSRPTRKVIRKRGRWVIYGYAGGRGTIDSGPFGYDGITIMPFSRSPGSARPSTTRRPRSFSEWMESEELISPTVHPLEQHGGGAARDGAGSAPPAKSCFRSSSTSRRRPMKLVDLTRPLDPQEAQAAARVCAQRCRRLGAADRIRPRRNIEGVDVMCAIFGCTQGRFAGRRRLGRRDVCTSIRTSGRTSMRRCTTARPAKASRRARSRISSSNELYCDGIVLDLRGLCEAGKAIEIDALKLALDRSQAQRHARLRDHAAHRSRAVRHRRSRVLQLPGHDARRHAVPGRARRQGARHRRARLGSAVRCHCARRSSKPATDRKSGTATSPAAIARFSSSSNCTTSAACRRRLQGRVLPAAPGALQRIARARSCLCVTAASAQRLQSRR